MKSISFKNKTFILILSLIIIFTLAIILTITNSFNQILENIIFENEINNTAQKAELTSAWFNEKKSDLEIYSNTQIIQQSNWTTRLNYLEGELQKRDQDFFFFMIADLNGSYGTTLSHHAGNISDRPYFEEVLKGNTVISNPLISRSTQEPLIIIATPASGGNLAMLGAAIRIEDLSNYINRYSIDEEGVYSFIINSRGNIVAHPTQREINNSFFYNYSSFFAYDYDFIDNIIPQQNGSLSFNENGQKKYAFYQNIEGTANWKIVSILPQNYLQRSINEVNRLIIIISIITIIIAVLLSVYLSQSISKPIIKLKNTFKKGAAGNLNIRAEIDTDDEIGEAAQSFNKMMGVIKNLSYNDSLTGLPNIHFFKKEVQKKLNQSEAEKIYISAIGIDDFKAINDGFGHNIGDQILIKLAERITQQLNEGELVSRVGDEFYFCISESSFENNITTKLNEILASINSNYFLNENVIFLRSSLGTAIYPNNGENINKLLKNASLAMHSVKKNSSKKTAFYSIDIDKNLSEKKKLENQLAAALEKEEFVLYYQSFNAAETEEIIGFEALIRWNHPKKGLISPAVFIPLAEENGLIKDIGNWVLEKACQDIKKLNDHFNSDYYLSVNVSPEQFTAKNFIKNVEDALNKTGLKAQNLELEITERTTVENIDYTIKVLNKLKEIGVKTSIDDFGTGYSSLNYIKEFAVSNLKIDKSFISDFIRNTNDKAIVKTIITLAQSLNFKVVAEGVENKDQAEQLKNFNCDIIQGYYYSYPESMETLISKLQKK